MAGKETAFECRRCGRCCLNLLAEDRGVLRGLTLLPEERELFPEFVVRPAVGIGRGPKEMDFLVIAYQMTEDTCPHLEENLCRIYTERPASCRQFPFSLRYNAEGKLQIGFDFNCPSLNAFLMGDPRPRIRFDARPHAMNLLSVELEAMGDPSRAWYFDLRNKEWRRYTELE